MLVENTKEAIHFIDVLGQAPVPNMPPVPEIEIRLMPGVNTVNDADWAKAKQNKGVRDLIDSGQLIEAPINGPGELKAKQAEELVGETFDKALLLTWLRDEKRAPVRKAIEAQLEKINPEPDRKKE